MGTTIFLLKMLFNLKSIDPQRAFYRTTGTKRWSHRSVSCFGWRLGPWEAQLLPLDRVADSLRVRCVARVGSSEARTS